MEHTKEVKKNESIFSKPEVEILMESFKIVAKENKDIVYMSDANIDTSPNAGSGHKFCSTKVEKEFNKYIEELDLTIMNNEYTRFRQDQDPSCIDHIITNCPKKMKNIATHTNSISDHETVSATYHLDGIKPIIAERIIKNTKNVTSENLE